MLQPKPFEHLHFDEICYFWTIYIRPLLGTWVAATSAELLGGQRAIKYEIFQKYLHL